MGTSNSFATRKPTSSVIWGEDREHQQQQPQERAGTPKSILCSYTHKSTDKERKMAKPKKLSHSSSLDWSYLFISHRSLPISTLKKKSHPLFTQKITNPLSWFKEKKGEKVKSRDIRHRSQEGATTSNLKGASYIKRGAEHTGKKKGGWELFILVQELLSIFYNFNKILYIYIRKYFRSPNLCCNFSVLLLGFETKEGEITGIKKGEYKRQILFRPC